MKYLNEILSRSRDDLGGCDYNEIVNSKSEWKGVPACTKTERLFRTKRLPYDWGKLGGKLNVKRVPSCNCAKTNGYDYFYALAFPRYNLPEYFYHTTYPSSGTGEASHWLFDESKTIPERMCWSCEATNTVTHFLRLANSGFFMMNFKGYEQTRLRYIAAAYKMYEEILVKGKKTIIEQAEEALPAIVKFWKSK